MITSCQIITVSGIPVEVIRKDIKNLHLGVYPPSGRVRVSAPIELDDETVRLAIISRLRWIHSKQQKFRDQTRQSAREYVSGESHYFQGRRYRLNVIEGPTKGTKVRLVNGSTLELRLPPDTDIERRRRAIEQWYRERLRETLPELIGQWEPIVGVKVREWRIKRMKTRWGTCNARAGRIWLNLELIKKPPHCLEYVVVHEMVHLLERHHNDNFRQLMDKALPNWRIYRDELNSAPLVHEDWKY